MKHLLLSCIIIASISISSLAAATGSNAASVCVRNTSDNWTPFQVSLWPSVRWLSLFPSDYNVAGIEMSVYIPKKRVKGIAMSATMSDTIRDTNGTVDGVALGMGPNYEVVNGVAAGVLGTVVDEEMNGLQAGLFGNYAAGEVRGVQIAAFSGSYIINANNAFRLNGAQISSFGNFVFERGSGIQLAGIGNFAANPTSMSPSSNSFTGVQMAGVLNYTKGQVSGLQIALVNAAGTATQLGILNHADSGLQFGLLKF